MAFIYLLGDCKPELHEPDINYLIEKYERINRSFDKDSLIRYIKHLFSIKFNVKDVLIIHDTYLGKGSFKNDISDKPNSIILHVLCKQKVNEFISKIDIDELKFKYILYLGI